MNKKISLATAFLSMTLLCGFAYGAEQNAQGNEASSTPVLVAQQPLPSGLERVSGIKDFKRLGIAITPPQGATNLEYFIVNSCVCVIAFNLGENHYGYQATNNPREVILDTGRLRKPTGKIDKFNAPCQGGKTVLVASSDYSPEGSAATWCSSNGKTRYSLSSKTRVQANVIQSLAKNIIKKDTK